MREQDYMTAEELADRLHVHLETVRRWCRLRKIKAVRIGRGYRISESEYQRILEEGITRVARGATSGAARDAETDAEASSGHTTTPTVPPDQQALFSGPGGRSSAVSLDGAAASREMRVVG